MANFIDDFIKQNEKVLAFSKGIGRNYQNADSNFDEIKSFLDKNLYNAALGVDVANSAQMLNKHKDIELFQLTDISRLFESLINLQESNIETYVEAGHFEFAVMQNDETAMKIVTAGISKAKHQIHTLSVLLAKIERDADSKS